MTREALLWSNRCFNLALTLPENHEGTILNGKWNLGQFHFRLFQKTEMCKKNIDRLRNVKRLEQDIKSRCNPHL